MKTLTIILLVILTMNTVQAQNEKNTLEAFENLVGGTWEGKGAWGNGAPINQQITFEWGLSGKMIKVKTYGNVSQEGFEFGLRNEGVRMWSKESSEVKFWEFDIFGGITEGTVDTDGNNIYYRYLYETGQGTTELTDAWIHQDKNTYQYMVGVYQNGEWIQTYLSATMKRNE